MKNIVVLVDANVILDYVTTRDPYYHDAYKIIDMCHSGIVKGYLAFHSISIIWYVLRKYMSDADSILVICQELFEKDFDMFFGKKGNFNRPSVCFTQN